MNKEQKTKWLVGTLVGLVCFAVTAAPPPEPGEKYAAGELAGRTADLEGKVVRVTFNRIAGMQKMEDGLYIGELRSRSKPEDSGDTTFFSDEPGVAVQFPVEGFGCLSKFIPEVGAGMNDINSLNNADGGEVYVQIGESVSVVLGDRYKDGEYSWSKKTEIPDLADAKKVSVSELYLFPDQVNGKTVQLEFYYAEKINKGRESCTVAVCSSYLGGHLPISIEFPAEGLEFFEEAANQDKSILRAYTVFASVAVSASGEISVKALGSRLRGKGDAATYKW